MNDKLRLMINHYMAFEHIQNLTTRLQTGLVTSKSAKDDRWQKKQMYRYRSLQLCPLQQGYVGSQEGDAKASDEGGANVPLRCGAWMVVTN